MARIGDGKMKTCPYCESDMISVNSSRELRISEIVCDDCGFSMQEKINEDALVKKWDKLPRSKSL
jgi:transposase-like protein